MIMTLFPNKRVKDTNNKSTTYKFGISVISSNIAKRNKKQNINGIQNDQNCSNRRKHPKSFRSLSVERVKRKKQKISKLQAKMENGNAFVTKDAFRQQMINSITELQAQYDELKMKRSLVSQRESQSSSGKLRLSEKYEQGCKNSNLSSSEHLINKCVPKSKIYLTNLSKSNNGIKQIQNSPQLRQKNQSSKKLGGYCENKMITLKRIKNKRCQNQISNVQNINESSHSCSLSNLQVIPVGLSITGINAMQKHKNRNQKSQQSQISSHKKRGINVISSQKSSKSSISSSSVSLYVSRQVKRDKKQITILKQYRGRVSEDICVQSGYFNNEKEYLRKQSNRVIKF